MPDPNSSLTPREVRNIQTCASIIAAIAGVVGVLLIATTSHVIVGAIGGFLLCLWFNHGLAIIYRNGKK